MDPQGYPDDSELERIRDWPPAAGYAELMDFVRERWRYPESWSEEHTRDGSTYTISTGGWSGNEDLICALSENGMFWLMCWYSSRRGGHFEFRVGAQFARRREAGK